MQRKTGVKMILVTHDQEDALSMSDSVVVLRAGHVEQRSDAASIYASPETLFVADFLGTPPISKVPVDVVDGEVRVRDGGRRIPIDPPGELAAPLVMAVRAESVVLAPTDSPRARVSARQLRGRSYLYDLDLGDDVTIRAFGPATAPLATGSETGYSILPGQCFFFNERAGRRVA